MVTMAELRLEVLLEADAAPVWVPETRSWSLTRAKGPILNPVVPEIRSWC